ncbi:uncharacterized protein LOC133817028 [Humulus lupulus]|uniref:uncharacterized protein LOC133817028 n=1 Tax=Humulus lupulus TaxID=3486 RepID=UPI002B40EB6F|nr:uncharacterized protein LOC133817028 [Humulus lupulus]
MENFIVVDCALAFYEVLGRPSLRELKAITSVYHLAEKFPNPGGITSMKGEQKEVRECYNTSLCTSVKPQEPMAMVAQDGTNPQELNPRVTKELGSELVDELEEIVVMEEPLRKLKVRKNLQDDTKEKLVKFLKDNLDVFAWSHEDMILMNPADKEYNSFIMDKGLYCYKVMPFGLKNAVATYQRLVKGEYQARGPKMAAYLKRVKGYLEQLGGYSIEKIPRERNTHVDALTKLASTKDGDILESVPVEYLSRPSIIETEIREARRLVYKVARYTLVDEVLYKRGFSVLLLRCVDEEEAMKVLYEIHEGECGNHASGPSTAKKAKRQGYYWPSMEKDASDFVRKCDKCQRHANYSQKPPNELTSLTSPWPFAIWRIDLIGAFPAGRGGAKYAVVVVDYFIKWVEVEPLIKITAKQITTFVNKSIVCSYGVPYQIISDNNTQFEGETFEEYCKEKGIRRSFSAVVHPHTNGQVEAINKVLKKNLKTKLENLKGT